MDIQAICRDVHGHENIKYIKDVSIHEINIYCRYNDVNSITGNATDPEDCIYFLNFALVCNVSKRSLIAKDQLIIPLKRETDPRVILDIILQEIDKVGDNGTLLLNDVIGDYII